MSAYIMKKNMCRKVINDSNRQSKPLCDSDTTENATVSTEGSLRDNGDTLHETCVIFTQKSGTIPLRN